MNCDIRVTWNSKSRSLDLLTNAFFVDRLIQWAQHKNDLAQSMSTWEVTSKHAKLCLVVSSSEISGIHLRYFISPSCLHPRTEFILIFVYLNIYLSLIKTRVKAINLKWYWLKKLPIYKIKERLTKVN